MNFSKNNEPIKPNTPLGVASFVLGIISFIFLILTGISGMLEEPSPGISPFMYIVSGLTSTVLAIVDLATGKGKKTLSIWALILVWGLLAISIITTIIRLCILRI